MSWRGSYFTTMQTLCCQINPCNFLVLHCSRGRWPLWLAISCISCLMHFIVWDILCVLHKRVLWKTLLFSVTAVEVWAWEGKCCLAVKVVTSSVREAFGGPGLSDFSEDCFGPSCATSCWSSGPLGWVGPALATTEPSGPLRDTARSATHSPPHERVQNSLAKTNQMKPDQPCKKQVGPPFGGEVLAQSWSLSSSFPLSHLVSNCLCWTRFLMLQTHTCVHTSGPGFSSLPTFYSVHTQWFDHHCGCSLASFPFSLFLPPFLLLACPPIHSYI